MRGKNPRNTVGNKNVHNIAHASERSTSVEDILTEHLRRGMRCKWHIQPGNPSIQPSKEHLLRTHHARPSISNHPYIQVRGGGQGDNRTTLKRTSVLKSTDKVLDEFKENYRRPKIKLWNIMRICRMERAILFFHGGQNQWRAFWKHVIILYIPARYKEITGSHCLLISVGKESTSGVGHENGLPWHECYFHTQQKKIQHYPHSRAHTHYHHIPLQLHTVYQESRN